MDALDDLFAFDADHLSEQRFGAFGGAAAQMAFAALCSHQKAGPGNAEPF